MALYGLVCLTLDLFPRFGPPVFRYTGSDPAVPVWNLGWPEELAIYDTRSGLHVGPAAYVVLFAQLFLALAAMAVGVVVRRAAGRARRHWRV